jgi:hypothetical protein
MTTEEIIIAIVRILGSLPVLRWPLAGGIIAILTDLSDLFLKNLIDEGGVSDYQEFDKWLDQVYMITFLIVALRWAAFPRNIAVALYAYRLAGFIVFEITQERDFLILFPNLYEFWFIFVATLHWLRLDVGANGIRPISDETPRFAGLIPSHYSRTHLAIAAVALLAAKLFQEYILHVGQWFEDFTAVEAVEAIWRFLTPPY